jgi:CheY-like chemotaxis protein
MRRILLVDDDPIVLRMYEKELSQQGVQVNTAGDGLAAITALHADKPDVVVLDLMMPKLSGVDVLRFIRSQPGLEALPVVALSNSYMNDLAREAAALGVQKALLKIRCSPAILLGAIEDALAGRTTTEDTAQLLAVAEPPPSPPPAPARVASIKRAAPAPAPDEDKPPTAEFQAKARSGFLQSAPATCATLRKLCQAFITAPNETDRDQRLQNLYRKVHFIAATAGLAECHHLAQMASAFEALLFELISKPAAITPSVLRTIASIVDFLTLLFDCARHSETAAPISAQALVIDDDLLSNRLVVAALQRAHLQARSTNDPLLGLQWLKETRYDLVLLDIEMPGMDGFELCRKLRALPGYKQIPVIYVTSHSDFDNRAKSILSGGDELISKPVFPMELAAKAVAQLLRKHAAA